jgi:transcription elongation factor GreA
MSKIPMTAVGAKKIQDELDKLKRVDRQNVIKAIAEARAHGDLKENAEYHAAKEQQGFIEARIRELESKLSHAQIIDVTKIANSGKVIFGATVALINVETDQKVAYQIVGDDEADLKHHKVSISSPIARALIGKHAGDCVEVKTPSGEVEYEIEAVDYI